MYSLRNKTLKKKHKVTYESHPTLFHSPGVSSVWLFSAYITHKQYVCIPFLFNLKKSDIMYCTLF